MTSRGRVLRTVVRDCLFLNWAFPLEALPALPAPLRYQEHVEAGQRFAFASALLFRHERLHLSGLPFLRLSYPQFHLRLYVLDHEGVASVFIHRILVPGWIVPSVRWVGHQPAEAGHFHYPRPSSHPQREEWTWEVVRQVSLRLSARAAAPQIHGTPSLGSWETTVDYFRRRRRGYALGPDGLRTIETSQQSVPLWPIRVSFADLGLLTESLALQEDTAWPELHSAWLCPEVPYVFELSGETVRASMHRSPVPVAPDPAMFRAHSRRSRRSAA